MRNFSVSPAALARLSVLGLPLLLIGCAGGGGGGNNSSTTTTPTPPAAALNVTAVSPTDVPVGSADFTLVVTGTGFTSSTVVSLNNAAMPTTYVSGTEVRAAVPATQLKTGAVLTVSAANGTTVVKADPAVTALSVDNPVPSFISITPAAVQLGSATTTVTVTGTSFVPGVALSVNGSPRDTTFVSDTKLTATLTADDFATAKSLPLNVINPKPGGGTSGTSAMTVNNPAPTLTSLSSLGAVQGSTPPTLTLTGTSFVPTSIVLVNGAQRVPTFVSSTRLTVTLTVADLANATSLPIAVFNAAPGGGTSASLMFSVTARATSPLISYVTPSALYTGSSDSTITIVGNGITSTSTVQWKGSNLAATYGVGNIFGYPIFSYTGPYLVAQVPASLLATAGTAAVTVTTASYPNPVSNSLTVTISDPPAPTITSLSPNVAPINADTPITIYGSGFTNRSTATFNGASLPVTFVNTGSLTATIPASAITFPGTGTVQVSTPAPGGGTSAGSLLTAYAPAVSNSMVYNPVNGLLYLSIPSTGSTIQGNSVVSMDPATGALGTPIFVGSEPNRMAISDDGTTLWVTLDGTYAVRKVDLVHGTAGAQFALSQLTSSNAATAIVAMPGSTDSVAVTNGYSLGIFDGGVLRGSAVSVNYSTYALQVDGTRKEIYAGGYGLQNFNYTNTGLTLRSTSPTSYYNIASASFDEMQLAGSSLYTDSGKVYEPEAGSLLGTLLYSSSSTTPAQGPTLYDAALGKIYVLDNSSGYSYNGYDQIQVFDPADYSNTGVKIPVVVPYSITTVTNGNYSYIYPTPHRLTRWGVNGLAFHTKIGVFSLQSNLVKDQSSASADLGVSVTSSGGITTGSTATYTATVTNNGPAAATDVAVTLQAPSTGVITSSTSSVGACPSVNGCILGSLAANATANITVKVLQTTAGTGVLTGRVRGSTTDSTSTNDSATASITVTGATYNLAPTLLSVTPSAVRTGAADTTITVAGTNFTSGSTVNLGSTALTTTFVSSTQLTAIVPSANLASLNWYRVTVSSPNPGGGTSAAAALTVYNVVAVGLNHIVYEPYTRKLLASVGSGSSSVTGSSITAIDPATATFGNPVAVSNAPNSLALSDSGKTLYATTVPTNTSNYQPGFIHYDVASGTASTVNVGSPSYYYGNASPIAIQPGSENTTVFAPNYYSSLGVYDYSNASGTFTLRGTSSAYYGYNTCINFLDATHVSVASSGLQVFPVTSNGLGTVTTLSTGPSTCFVLKNGKAYTISGQVYNVTPTTASLAGSFTIPSYSYNATVAPDPSLGLAFFPGSVTSSYSADSLLSYDTSNYVRTGTLPLNIPAIEGTSSISYINDLVRWGQDGLALVTATGHIYFVRGPFVVPQLLNTNTAAVLTSSSASTITHGADNTLLTLTGSNFIPGVAVTWNGSYRTTTIVDATHVTVAIPASDLAVAGTGSLVATNPGASASSTITVTVQ